MLYRTSSFKQSSRLVTAATAFALFSGASLLATQTARADEPSNFTAACASIKDGAKRAGCMIDAIEKNTKELKAKEERSKREGQQADASAPCIQFLLDKVAAKLTTPDELKNKAGGELNDANVCRIAKDFGYVRKAELIPAVKNSATRATPIAYSR